MATEWEDAPQAIKVNDNNIKSFAGIGASGYATMPQEDQLALNAPADSDLIKEAHRLEQQLPQQQWEDAPHGGTPSGSSIIPKSTSTGDQWEDAPKTKTFWDQIKDNADKSMDLVKDHTFGPSDLLMPVKAALGMGETLSNMTTGFGGMIGGGLVKGVTAPFMGADAANEIGNQVSDSLTDEPRTDMGKSMSQFANKAFSKTSDALKDTNPLKHVPGLSEAASQSLTDAGVDLGMTLLPAHIIGKVGGLADRFKGKSDAQVNVDSQLAALQKEINASKQIQPTPTSEIPSDLPPLNMDGVPPMIHDAETPYLPEENTLGRQYDPVFDKVPDNSPAPLLNQWDGTQSKGFPQISEPDADGHITPSEAAAHADDPLSPENKAARQQADIEQRYQDKNDFNHPEETPIQMALKKAQENSAWEDAKGSPPISKEEAFQKNSDTIESQRQIDSIKADIDKQLQIVKDSGGTLSIDDRPMNRFNKQRGAIDLDTFAEGIAKIGKYPIDLVKKILNQKEDTSPFNGSNIPEFLAKKATDRLDEQKSFDTMVNEKPINALKEISPVAKALSDLVPDKRPMTDIISDASKLPDIDQNLVQRMSNQLTSGGLWQSLKTRNPIVKKTYEVMVASRDSGQSLINHYIKDADTGLLPMYRKLSLESKVKLWNSRIIADAEQFKMTPEGMERLGWTKDEVTTYITTEHVMDAALKSINEARAITGRGPIDRRVGYAMSKMVGDFRKPVFIENTTGEREFVGQIGANTRGALKKIEAQLMATHPEWKMGEESFMGKGSQKDTTGTRQADTNAALQFLTDNSPHVKELVKVLSDSYIGDAYDYQNAKKHTIPKKENVTFGSEGRKEWKSSETNAQEFMKAEILYAETMFKWGEYSKGVQELAPLLSAPEVKMPIAKEWAEAYIDKAMGVNPTDLGKVFDGLLGVIGDKSGLGSANISKGVRGIKGTTNKVLLALNPMFLAINIIQPAVGMPKLKALMASRGLGENLKWDAGTGYRYMLDGAMTMLKSDQKLTSFEKALNFYGKEHNLFGNEILDHSAQVHKDMSYYASKVTDFGINTIESKTNQVAFIAISNMLKDSGMSLHEGLFETAQKMTKMIMHDYSPQEAPTLFDHLGLAGTMARNLTKYKTGELSQLAFMAREIPVNGAYRPLATHYLTTIAYAGIMGTAFYNTANQVVEMMTKKMGHPMTLSKLLLDNVNLFATHGALGHLLGVDLTSRLGSPDTIPTNIADAAFPGVSKVGDAIGATYNAATQPSEMNGKRMLRELAPGIATGPMDRQWFSTHNAQGEELGISRKPSDFHGLQGQVPRTDTDKFWKNFGAQGEHESVEKLKKFNNDSIANDYTDLRKKTMADLNDSYFANGNTFTPQDIMKAKDKYIKQQGDPNQFAAELQKMAMDLKTSANQRDLLKNANNNVTSTYNLKRMFGK